MTAFHRTIIGILLASLLLLLLAAGAGLFFFCSAAWCPDVAPSKRAAAVDFASCQQLKFPVEQTSPPRCIAGNAIYYASADSRLRIVEPRSDQAIALPLVVEGDVRIGSGTTARLLLTDRDEFALAEDRIPLPKALSGQIVPFSASVSFPRPLGTGGTLTVSLFTQKGKLLEQAVVIPVRFPPIASVEIKAFFGNTERDPKTMYCDVSYPVARRVSVSEDLLAASLRELISGPGILEQRQGFFSVLPDGLIVRSLKDDDGNVTVTFNKALVEGVAGSCRVAAIRSQIERTLRQFPFVKEVTIAVEGMSDAEILQP
ncbi:MAG: GerMN domain-containing protein [Candidatus Peribacteraceae bacterium]|nr:GerMN domain-containing protein [Candidatus Peribacteraceae bacterium]MDD5739827.1 GerMN domain-containing protein [Candidatus Peribacteraceae bacterium]